MSNSTKRCRASDAFTIIEVMIALTASLLLMLGLTRAFKLIGDRITTSQSELELSSELRDVTFRLRDELRRITPSFDAPLRPGRGDGYFHYYEGPWTDATTSLIHSSPVTNSDLSAYHPTSRYGDLDDYIAFTTRSDSDKPFTGLIPAGILEAVRLERHLSNGGTIAAFLTLNGETVGTAGTFTREHANALVLIYSDVAEICYFAAPEWRRSALGVPIIADPTGTPPSSTPEFVDNVNEVGTATGDNIPDRITLRRRILLVRPDLNLSRQRMLFLNSRLGSSTAITAQQIAIDVPQLPFFDGSGVVPLNQVPQFDPGVWGAGINNNSPNWLTGMARIHQWMDLSVSRFTDSTTLGTPLVELRANTLDELSSPENRFAAVRMPIALMNANSLAPFTGAPITFPTGATAVTSSMPLLALSPPHRFITSSEAAGFSGGTDPIYSAMGGQAAGTAAAHHFALVGFVRPEFTLADHWFDFGTTTARPTLRGGSDIVAQDILAFDVQVFDPDAVVAVWTGPDGQPGDAGVDDDENGTNDDTSELGFADSDDLMIDGGSKGMRTALNNAVIPLPAASTTLPTGISFVTIPYGSYVDNGYVRLAGSSIGGNALTRISAAMQPSFITAYSGFRTETAGNSFPVDWQESGKFVLSSGPVPSFYQASIDTWTSTYDTDDFVQPRVNWVGSTMAPLAFTGNINTTSANSRYWSVERRLTVPANKFVSPQTAAVESNPPSSTMPQAVKIIVRIYDRASGEVRQQSIIQRFD